MSPARKRVVLGRFLVDSDSTVSDILRNAQVQMVIKIKNIVVQDKVKADLIVNEHIGLKAMMGNPLTMFKLLKLYEH